MEPLTPASRRRRGRAASLVATLSLLLAPLVVAPNASAAPVAAEVADEPSAAATDVVAPAADQLLVDGVLQVGEDVTIDPRPELWAPADVELAFTYRWIAGDTVIAEGAEPTLTLAPETAGVQVSVEVTGTAPEGAVDGARSASVLVPASGTVADGEIVATAPTISGTPQVGQTLSAHAGTWEPAVNPTYRWLRAGAAISGATKSTYTVTAADLGKAISVEVSGTAEGYAALTLTSQATSAVAAAGLATGTPTIVGTVRVGSKVTAKPGTWTSGTTLDYQWYASGAKISGATTSTYTPTSGTKGRTLTVKVTGKKTGYTTVTRTSLGTKVAAGVLSAPKPKIKGTVKAGSTVSVTRGTWKPGATAYRYQWKVGGRSIPGATRSTYTIPAKYAGKKLTVTVTGSRSGYTTRTVTSSSTTVLRVYAKTSAPRISGTVRVGSTLKVGSKGTWSPAPKTWRYQWKANGTAIKGATRSSFKLTSAQHGKRITVTVSGVRSGYATASRSSSATAKVAWPVGVSKPKVTGNPAQKWVTSGQTATFSVKATGGHLRYQWQISPDGTKWSNLSGKTSSTLKLSVRASRDGSRVRAVVKNVAGTATSKAAMLWVDSTRSDPYRPNVAFSTLDWSAVIGKTGSTSSTTSTKLVSAPMAVCYYGDDSALPWLDLDIEYVGSNGVVYDDNYEFFDDDIWGTTELYAGGCTSFTAYAVVSNGAVSGGTWRLTDSSAYPTYVQWVDGA
ncbi:hypothetical protein AAG589_13765 [Isoptericola sp. F-RaC21]|uniref:hypothetical protein n=1 Tax=Isoptericola sp. F-RaC21 TaxID=3141452 RepID=UPI00315BCA63